MGKWDRTRERMSNQIAFPEGWYDASIIMIEYTDPQSTTTDLDLFSFLTPFEWTVWMLILATIVASGLVYYLLEKMNTASDERTLEEAPVSAVYYSAITFTGHLEFRPQTHAARLVAFSLSFSALIVAAAYTANLASFLVARRQPSSTLQSIQDAVAQRAPICLQASVALDQYITNQYPSAVLVRNYSESDVFEGLVQGECRVAVVPKYSYETYLKNSEINSDCGLTWQGRVEKFVPSGLASRVDTGNLCTSLVSHVLDLHLLEMDADGFLDVVWEEHIQRVGNQNCLVESSGPTGELEDDTYSLSIQEMAGIFIVHTVLTSIAVLLAIFQFFMEKRRAVVEPTERRDNTLLTEAPQVNGSQATISTNGKQPAACGEEAPPSTVGLIGDAFYHNAETIEV
jgi:flagellar basal body-associated protein FliL